MEIGQTGGAGNRVLELVEEVQELDYDHAHPLHHQKQENIASKILQDLYTETCKEKAANKKNAPILVSNN